MAIKRMEVKKMHRTYVAASLLMMVVLFAVSSVEAVNYGSGLYNAGLYSSTAADTTAPIISSVSSGTPNQTTATITWTTNENADSQVQYGLTTSYGTTTTLDATLVTSHSVPLSGLTAATTYHYRVISKDAAVNTTTSSDATFTTSAIPDTTAPSRSAGSPTGSLASSTTSTTLSLSTDEAATCRYSQSAGVAYGSMSTTFGTTGGTTHSTTVSALASGQSYDYYVRCIDTASNANLTDYTISFAVSAASGVPPVVPASTIISSGSMPVSATSVVVGCTATTAFSPLNGQRCPSIAVVPQGNDSTLLAGIRSLSWKMSGEDVRALQHYLNTHGYPVAPSGVGSIGKETTYFGLATKAALIKFQIAHAILPATGTYGPKSKTFVKLNP